MSGRSSQGWLARLGARRPARWGAFLLRAALTLAVLTALLLWLPAEELLAAMRRTGISLWLLLLAITVTGHVVNAVKWRVLIRAAGVDGSFRQVLSAHAAGLFAGIWLPSLVGGDVVRAGLLARRAGRLAPLAAAGIVDRLLDTAALILLAVVGLCLTPQARSAPALRILAVAVAAVLAVGLVAPLALRRFHARLLGTRLGDRVERLRSAVDTIADHGGAASRALALSLGVQGSFVLANVPLAAAIGLDVPVVVWFLVWPLAKLAALAPISLAGLGVREVAQVALLAPFGIDPTLAVAQSLVWQSLMLSVGAIAGFGTLALQGRDDADERARDEADDSALQGRNEPGDGATPAADEGVRGG